MNKWFNGWPDILLFTLWIVMVLGVAVVVLVLENRFGVR